jgi:hypothetical protein
VATLFLGIGTGGVHVTGEMVGVRAGGGVHETGVVGQANGNTGCDGGVHDISASSVVISLLLASCATTAVAAS